MTPTPFPALGQPPRLGAAYTGAALVLAAGLTGLIVLVADRTPRVVLWMVAPAALLAQAAAVLACRRAQRHDTVGWSRWPLWLGSAAIAGGIGATSGIAIGAAALGRWGQLVHGPAMPHGLFSGMLLGACIAIAWRLVADGHARERALLLAGARLEHERLRLAREVARAELQVMQAQVEPHFLYNTLANLRQLIRTDAPLALQMNEQLIRYFKALTASLSRARVSLDNELTLCDAYVEIMKLRWGGRIDYAVRCDAGADARRQTLQVPPGSLLTLVENAIKHGQPQDGGDSSIRIDVALRDGRLRLGVADNGPGPPHPGPHPGAPQGAGLANLNARLSLLYGDAAGASVRTGAAGGCEAIIELPDMECPECVPAP